MKNEKVKKGFVIGGTLLTIGLYVYSLYSAFYTFKRGVKSDIVIFTVLLAVCSGIIMLLYTLMDKKRAHSTANKIIVPVITAAVNAGVYLGVGYGFQEAFSPNSGGKLAASASAVMFGIAFAVYMNGVSSRGHKAVFKSLAAVGCIALSCWGVYTTANSVKDQSYLSFFYAIISGKGKVVIDGEEAELTAGDWLRIAPEAKRQFSASADSAIEFVCIQVKKDSLGGFTADDAVVY